MYTSVVELGYMCPRGLSDPPAVLVPIICYCTYEHDYPLYYKDVDGSVSVLQLLSILYLTLNLVFLIGAFVSFFDCHQVAFLPVLLVDEM